MIGRAWWGGLRVSVRCGLSGSVRVRIKGVTQGVERYGPGSSVQQAGQGLVGRAGRVQPGRDVPVRGWRSRQHVAGTSPGRWLAYAASCACLLPRRISDFPATLVQCVCHSTAFCGLEVSESAWGLRIGCLIGIGRGCCAAPCCIQQSVIGNGSLSLSLSQMHTQGVERTGQGCWPSIVPRVVSINSSQALCLLQCNDVAGREVVCNVCVYVMGLLYGVPACCAVAPVTS